MYTYTGMLNCPTVICCIYPTCTSFSRVTGPQYCRDRNARSCSIAKGLKHSLSSGLPLESCKDVSGAFLCMQWHFQTCSTCLWCLRMQILWRPSRPELGAYEPCCDITLPTTVPLPDVQGELQSSFTIAYSRFRLEIIVFDPSAFSEFPKLFMHNACCATSPRTQTPQTAYHTHQYSSGTSLHICWL